MSDESRTGAEAAGRGRVVRRDALRILAVGGAAGAAWGLGAFRRSGPVEREQPEWDALEQEFGGRCFSLDRPEILPAKVRFLIRPAKS